MQPHPWPPAPNQHHPAPIRGTGYLLLLLAVLVGAYLLLAFLTGDKRTEPGIEQLGGTRMTLTARTPDGSPPTHQALSQAQQTISSRAAGFGISRAQVVVAGDNLVVTTPGANAGEVRKLTQTGRFFMRPVRLG